MELVPYQFHPAVMYTCVQYTVPPSPVSWVPRLKALGYHNVAACCWSPHPFWNYHVLSGGIGAKTWILRHHNFLRNCCQTTSNRVSPCVFFWHPCSSRSCTLQNFDWFCMSNFHIWLIICAGCEEERPSVPDQHGRSFRLVVQTLFPFLDLNLQVAWILIILERSDRTHHCFLCLTLVFFFVIFFLKRTQRKTEQYKKLHMTGLCVLMYF